MVKGFHPLWVPFSPKRYVCPGIHIPLENPELSRFVFLLEANSKNPLDNNECPNAGNGDAQEAKWLATAFPPLVDGLNIGAPGANLTPEDVYNLMALCPYDSLASMKLSPLCQLFADEEFELFEYANDIDKYYGTG